MKKRISAAKLHDGVPPDWYYRAVTKEKNNIRKYVHLTRFREVGKLIEKTSGKVLDIGSADGMFTKVILDKTGAQEIIGIDVLKSSVSWANRHWGKVNKMKFMVADAHKLPFNKNSFDAVFALEVLEHVYEPVKVLTEIKRVLKKNGYIVFLVPAETLLFRTIWYFGLNIQKAKFGKKLTFMLIPGILLQNWLKSWVLKWK